MLRSWIYQWWQEVILRKIPRRDEVVTQILPVSGDAAKLVENLRPLLPDSSAATITANESSNAIIMTDTQTNIRRIAQIIHALGDSLTSISSIRVFPLQFADAKEVATIINQLFTTNTTGRGDQNQRPNFGGFPGFGFGRGGGGGGPGGGGRGSQQSSSQSEARQAASRVVAVADEQSNNLIVTAPETAMTTIAQVVAQLDTSINDVTENRIFGCCTPTPSSWRSSSPISIPRRPTIISAEAEMEAGGRRWGQWVRREWRPWRAR
jgi:type II secretory pathway component GspD/PulD (secretin)